MQSHLRKTVKYRAPQYSPAQLREYAMYLLHRCSGRALELLDQQIAEVRYSACSDEKVLMLRNWVFRGVS